MPDIHASPLITDDMPDMSSEAIEAERSLLAQRVLSLRGMLKANALDPDHPPAILAVTKTVPVWRVVLLPKDEIIGIGENHAQEIRRKTSNAVECRVGSLENLPIHMIGRLQTNKIVDIIEGVALIQSLDRMTLAQAIDRAAGIRGITARCLVQVNIGREAQKGGVAPEDTIGAVRVFARLPGVKIDGLMAVMPYTTDEELLTALFREMRTLFTALRDEAIAGVTATHLSMGMSGDCALASREGSTMVRAGSAIFGPREVSRRGSEGQTLPR